MAQDLPAKLNAGPSDDVEEHVVIDFGNAESQPHMSQSYRLIGLDTAHPYMQLDDVLFRGTWARSVGTDLHYDAAGELVAKSVRRLIMHRVEVVKKGDQSTKLKPRDRIARAAPQSEPVAVATETAITVDAAAQAETAAS